VQGLSQHDAIECVAGQARAIGQISDDGGLGIGPINMQNVAVLHSRAAKAQGI